MKKYIFNKSCFIKLFGTENYFVDHEGKKITGAVFPNTAEDTQFKGLNDELIGIVEDGKYHNANGPAIITNSGRTTTLD